MSNRPAIKEQPGGVLYNFACSLGYTERIEVGRQTQIGLAVIAAAGVILLAAVRIEKEMAIFWLFGLAFGFVLQKSRFCFASAFRDIFLLRHGRVMKGLLAGLAVATVGFALIMSNFVPNPRLGFLPPEAHIMPLGLSIVVGGLLFGLGMVVAGGCVSGSIYRMGEGYVASWVAFLGIMAGLLTASYTWNWWWRFQISRAPRLWLPAWFGHGGAVVVTLIGLGLVYLLVLWWESRGGLVIPEFHPEREEGETFAEKLNASLRSLFVDSWTATRGGLALGALNVFLYISHHPWGITGEIGRWSNGFANWLGIGAGKLEGTDTLAGCAIVSPDGSLLNHMLFLVVGMVVGSLIAALLAHEFKIRIPRSRTRYVQASGGGLVMGYGAGIAMGCTIGGFFSAIPSLAVNGWVFGLALAVGAFLGTLTIQRLP
ncbi:MAG: YeeE/YedE family protein [Anaerolineae bacterium]